MASFAEVADLEARWRPLSPDERARAAVLLGDASAIIRSLAPSVDDQIATGRLDPTIPKAIACAMVKRSMDIPSGMEGVSQYSETTGPFTDSRSYSNPAGDMYLKADERKRLGIGRQRAFTVDQGAHSLPAGW